MTPHETTDKIKQLPDGPKAFYKQVKSTGIDIHVIYNFGSHRVDADLSFGESCDGLRDDYIENIIKEAAEHAVTALNEYPSLVTRLEQADEHNKALVEENEQLDGENERLMARLEQAEAALRDARTAIEKYADEDEWLCDTCDNPYGQCNASLHRLGNWQGSPNGPTIARKWLDENGEEK